MTTKQVLKELEALGNEKTRAQNTKQGAGPNQYGVQLGQIRKLAKKIKTNPKLAADLWETGNIDARFLAILLMKPKDLAADEIDRLVRSIEFTRVADWFNSYVIKGHPDSEALREKWMTSDDPMAARAGWNLTATRLAKSPDGLDVVGLLDRLESEMGGAVPEVQWTMNFSLVEIGINFPKLRKRTIAVGEALGIYRDYPTAKGCTSPYAPIWIEEMVSRQS